MGYFSNGTDEMFYREQYCHNCIHCDEHGNCPVMDIHLDYNYGQKDGSQSKSILDRLIPMKEDKIMSGQCTMFIQIKSKGQTNF